MNRAILLCLRVLAILPSIGTAQTSESAFPARLTVARHTFFDFGPPNDFYDVIHVVPKGTELSVERALVTPAGIACVQPPTVELSSGILHQSMEELLLSKNPCAIPEKELHREQARYKKCHVFSGVKVTMEVSCGGKERQIRMDILDRDLFSSSARTPENTSWSMAVLQKLDGALGPGAMEKPTFPVDTGQRAQPARSNLTDQLLDGTFDSLFGPQVRVSAIAREATKAPSPPTIQIESVSPIAPIEAELPKYPPIAKLARLEGLIEATFDVAEDGVIRNISFVNEPRLRMLQAAVSESLPKWKFPQSAWGKSEKASIRFQLNCTPNPS